jgi:hypothetical protein
MARAPQPAPEAARVATLLHQQVAQFLLLERAAAASHETVVLALQCTCLLAAATRPDAGTHRGFALLTL